MKRNANHSDKPAYHFLQSLPLEERLEKATHGHADILSQLVFDQEEKVLHCIVENPHVTEKILLAICRRRVIPARILEKISKNRKWMQNYQIRYELIRNPRTPVYISLRYVKTLLRLELSNLVRDVSVPAAIRVHAEHILKERLKDLTLGDKIALAHTASAPILRLLLMEGESPVVKSALENSRLRENDLLYILNTGDIDEDVLETVIANKRWSNRYEVKLAIARHPRISPKNLRNLLKLCLQQDLQDIVDTISFPLTVRMEAKKMMRERINDLSQGDKLLLAKKGKKDVLSVLVYEEDEEIFSNLLKNPYLREEHVITISYKTQNPQTLASIARNEEWRSKTMIALALFENDNSPEFIKEHLKEIIEQDPNHNT
jgi:hypothetical protein